MTPDNERNQRAQGHNYTAGQPQRSRWRRVHRTEHQDAAQRHAQNQDSLQQSTPARPPPQQPSTTPAEIRWGVGEVLSVIASVLLRFERVGYHDPASEAKGCAEWDRWAARWHAAWVTKVWGPPTRKKKEREAAAGDKRWYKAALQVLNAMRARNQFRWLTAKVAQGCTQKERSVAGKHWQQTNWVAHVLISGCTPSAGEQERYIPAQARDMLKEMTLTHPRTAVQRGDGDANEAPTTGAWIYAMRSIRSRRTYIGATDRLGQQPQ